MTLARHAGCLLLGAAVALAAVAVHRDVFPWGLVLSLVTTFTVAWWLLGSAMPRGAASYVAGWVVVMALAVQGRPEGDYVLASDLDGYALLAAGVILVPFALVALIGRRRPRS